MQELSKSGLRKTLKAKRALFARSTDRSVRRRVTDNLQLLLNGLMPQISQSSKPEIWSYVAYADEAPADLSFVDQSPIEIAYPKIVDSELDFYIPQNPAEMEPNHYGIPEPLPQKSRKALSPKLVVVPGVGFDHQGHRLGSGKGFYDRVLNKFPKAIRVGVAYAAQISKEVLPVEAHDKGMDWIVTENYILQCERRG